ncbi:3-oxo-5-alpha-steroid 4-dehydrogenase-domain-containing protein [Massariosphaeria phaeospora]|uniref:very-long-chain enoyl-CoA reductase n=1 Tax=Massariosphaeria phaeospora TaxID=100035 RepID=A0A7C8MCU6_9PLEO|nr:3-oxo-5-alpha-steroid 4-dehydrogenase-domain-containing protein [Massariosphaeria phaeospora]
MASSVIDLTIRPRGKPIKNLPELITIGREDSTSQIFQKISDASKFSANRLRVTKGSDGSPIPNATDVTVHDTGLRNRSAVDVKDLGPQIAWRTVFIIEYLGPLLVHPLFYYGRPLIYGTSTSPSELQKLSLILVMVHFIKREYETLFVHRFSLATMPAILTLKNFGHYWFLGGMNLAYWTYAPTAPTARASNPLFTYFGLALFVLGELGTLYTHNVLKNLRRPGSTDRGIPRGLGFDLVTCPNYMFEIVAWAGFWLINWSLSTIVFVVVAAIQMALWAQKKERRYRKEFGDKYKRKRFVMLPGIY